MRRFLDSYGLTVALAVFFLISWLVQSVAGWVEFVAEQKAHQQTASLFGDGGYIWSWLQATFENWQSEFLQLFTFVVLTVFLVHRHSHESKDETEKMAAQIEELLAMVRSGRSNGRAQ